MDFCNINFFRNFLLHHRGGFKTTLWIPSSFLERSYFNTNTESYSIVDILLHFLKKSSTNIVVFNSILINRHFQSDFTCVLLCKIWWVEALSWVDLKQHFEKQKSFILFRRDFHFKWLQNTLPTSRYLSVKN